MLSRPRDPDAQARRDLHRRGEVLPGALRRHRARTAARAIMWQDRPLAHQSQDEGGARRAGRRDVRPHVLRRPLLRLRRRPLRRLPADRDRRRLRQAALGAAGRACPKTVTHARDPRRLPRRNASSRWSRASRSTSQATHDGDRRRRRARDRSRTAGAWCAPPTRSPCWCCASRPTPRKTSMLTVPKSKPPWRPPKGPITQSDRRSPLIRKVRGCKRILPSHRPSRTYISARRVDAFGAVSGTRLAAGHLLRSRHRTGTPLIALPPKAKP